MIRPELAYSALVAITILTSSTGAASDAPRVDARVHASATLSAASADRLLPEWQRAFFARRLARMRSASPAPLGRGAPALSDSVSEGVWSRVAGSPKLGGHVVVYDHAADRIVLFGGMANDSLFNDVWELPLTGRAIWRRISPVGAPPAPRLGATAIYDAYERRLILFGGVDVEGSYLDDLWALSLDGPAAWTQLQPSGGAPGARVNHAAIVDTLNHRMVIYGGSDGGFTALAEVWALALSATPTWSELLPGGMPPEGRTYPATLYDPTHQRMLMYGGYAGQNEYPSKVWSLTLDVSPAWSLVTTTYGGPGGPEDVRLFYDAGDETIVAHGGYSLGVVYWLSMSPPGTGWNYTPAPDFRPPPRARGGWAFDTRRSRVLLVAGGLSQDGSGRGVADVWASPIQSWSQWTRLYDEPLPRWGHQLVIDRARERALMFGGYADSLGNYSVVTTNQLWQLSLGDTIVWTMLAPDGGPLLGRADATLVFDSTRDRLVLFGGTRDGLVTNEVWALTLSGTPAWSRLHPTGTLPRGRSGHGSLYDAASDRMVTFGGWSQNEYLDDTWSLEFTPSVQWKRLLPSGTPPSGRELFGFAFDSLGRRAFVVGGEGYSSPQPVPLEIYALSLQGSGAWTQLAGGGLNYSVASQNASIWDPNRARLVRLGSEYAHVGPSVKTFRPGVDSVWTDVFPSGGVPVALSRPGAVYDPLDDRVLTFSGYTSSYGVREDAAWVLSFGAPPLAVPRAAGGAALALRVVPNPTRLPLHVRFTLPTAGDVRLRVLDVSGRRVAGREIRSLAPGSHDVDLSDSRLAPGLYFVQVECSGRQSGTRFVVVR